MTPFNPQTLYGIITKAEAPRDRSKDVVIAKKSGLWLGLWAGLAVGAVASFAGYYYGSSVGAKTPSADVETSLRNEVARCRFLVQENTVKDVALEESKKVIAGNNARIKSLESAVKDYKKSVELKDAKLAEAEKSLNMYTQKLEELDAKTKTLAAAVDAQKGSESQKERSIADLSSRLIVAEKQAKELGASVVLYKKDVEQKDNKIAGLEKQVGDLQKQPRGAKYQEEAATILTNSAAQFKELKQYQEKLKKIEKAGGLISFGDGDDRLIPLDEYKAYKIINDRFKSDDVEASFILFSSPDRLKELSFSNICGIKAKYSRPFLSEFQTVYIRQEISKFQYLERIDLEDADIASNTNLRGLPNLKVINFSNCKSESLSGFGSLPELVEFSAENSSLKSIQDIFNLPSLRRVNLLNSGITSLKDFAKMPALKELIVAGCPIDYRIPENQDALKNMKEKGVNVIVTGEEYYKWAESAK
jgi:hypothetical protein